MAATSLHAVVHLDSEECHELAVHRAYAYDYSLVRSLRAPEVAKGQHKYFVEWMSRMGAMEELGALCGTLCWRWIFSSKTPGGPGFSFFLMCFFICFVFFVVFSLFF